MPVGVVEDDDFERVINTNLIGSWRVANAFVPLLRACVDGAQALVIISSIASHMIKSEMTPIAYNLSKICMNRLAEHIHHDHFEKDGVLAFAVHPVSESSCSCMRGPRCIEMSMANGSVRKSLALLAVVDSRPLARPAVYCRSTSANTIHRRALS